MMNFAASSVQSVDDLARAAVSTMGSSAAFLPAPISGHECRRVAVPNAYSQAWRLGRTVLEAQLAQTDPDCVNKDTVSFDYTTGQCLCDMVRARPGRRSALGVP